MVQIASRDTSSQVEQDVVTIKPGMNKADVLTQLLSQQEFAKVIVFGRTKRGITKLEKTLYDRGIRVSSIHGNKTQAARQKSLQRFAQGSVQALLATDVASRGIDIENVTHVINYDEPNSRRLHSPNWPNWAGCWQGDFHWLKCSVEAGVG